MNYHIKCIFTVSHKHFQNSDLKHTCKINSMLPEASTIFNLINPIPAWNEIHSNVIILSTVVMIHQHASGGLTLKNHWSMLCLLYLS
jgi:hypothetical protein